MAPRVDMLIHFLVRDEDHVSRWQSRLFTFQIARRGSAVTLWGRVLPSRVPVR